MPVLIGIKYCGGCNPFYDRKAEVEKLERSMTGVRFEPVRRNRSYDKILLVCGCPRMCIRKYITSGKHAVSEKDQKSEAVKYYIVKSKEDFSKIQELLKK